MTYRSSSELADIVASKYQEGADAVRQEAFLAISSVRSTPEVPGYPRLALEAAEEKRREGASDAEWYEKEAIRVTLMWLRELTS